MRKLSLLALVLGFAACRGDDTGDDTGSDANPQKTEYTIQEIQDAAMPACDIANPSTCVNLTVKGVVVTAIDVYGSKTGDFWVQEPEGGAYSGVHVYGAPLDQVAALALGDVVDITGAQKSEFALDSDTSGNKLTELEPVEGGTMTVTKVMSGTPLEPTVVDALAIGQMTDFTARDAEWEKYEGVLIKINNPQAFSSDKCVGSGCSDTTLRSFEVTGKVLVESALAAMPDPAVKLGDCFTSVTGVLDYFFDYQILPRTTAEIAGGGTACPLENTETTCGDGIDNDGNGFKDCMDFSCQSAVASCSSQTSIADVQAGTATGVVQLEGVYVTGIAFNKKNFWVATSLTAAPNEGIYVFRGSGAAVLDTTIVVGAKVDVVGTATEYNNDAMGSTLTQLTNPTVTFVAAPTTAPVPLTNQTAATLKVDATGEPYESVLVQLTNVKVTAAGTAMDYLATMTQNGTTFTADDDMYRIVAADVTKCYSSIIGMWSYNAFVNDWVFLPRTATAGGPDAVLAANQSDCN